MDGRLPMTPPFYGSFQGFVYGPLDRPLPPSLKSPTRQFSGVLEVSSFAVKDVQAVAVGSSSHLWNGLAPFGEFPSGWSSTQLLNPPWISVEFKFSCRSSRHRAYQSEQVQVTKRRRNMPRSTIIPRKFPGVERICQNSDP